MHAYLVVGRSSEDVDKEVGNIARKLNAKILPFAAHKIEQVRELASYTRLSQKESVVIVIADIDRATIPAMNAFLKNLEEPQKNLSYILTARSIHSVLPTIVSRCLVVVVSGKTSASEKAASTFLNKSFGEKLTLLDKYKKREEAVEFIEKFIVDAHKLLTTSDKNHTKIAEILKNANKTLGYLKANGNVTLQLTNFAISTI